MDEEDINMIDFYAKAAPIRAWLSYHHDIDASFCQLKGEDSKMIYMLTIPSNDLDKFKDLVKMEPNNE